MQRYLRPVGSQSPRLLPLVCHVWHCHWHSHRRSVGVGWPDPDWPDSDCVAGVVTKCCQGVSADLTTLEWHSLVREKLTQHILQDATMPEVGSLGWCIDADNHLELPFRFLVFHDHRHALRDLLHVFKPDD